MHDQRQVKPLIVAFSFIFLAPQFPYRLPIVIVAAVITAKIAFLPFNYFLALELEKINSRRLESCTTRHLNGVL